MWAVDANSHFSRPAPRLVEGVENLAHILHPEVFPEAPADGNTVCLDLSRVGKARSGGAADRRRDARLT